MVFKNEQVSEAETLKIIELAKESLLNDGDYVELGCYRGDTSLALAEVINGSKKRLWIYDSFEGLPEKTEKDYSVLGQGFRKGELGVTKREVKERFLRAGFSVPVIKKAWFSELTDTDLPDRIAFAFLDGDFYGSIRDSLKLIENKMSNNGMILVHDYNNPALPGVKKAVDEWMVGKRLKIGFFQSLIMIML